jgi:hypothetical protein
MRSLLLCTLLAGTTAFVARPSIVQRQSTGVLSTPKSVLSSTTARDTDQNGVSGNEYELLGRPARPGRPLKVAVAGGGVGGLTAALCLLKKGFDVTVYEKTAAFARFGGPIQFASNALSVLKEIDDVLFDRVMAKFTFTGTRTCGIKDGLRADGSFRMTNDSIDYLWNPDAPADWFVKFPLKVRGFWRMIAVVRGRAACLPCDRSSHFYPCLLSFYCRNARISLDSPTRA